MPRLKSTAILTFFNRLNYGADLQAFALQQVVQNMGIACELLDVLSPQSPDATPSRRFPPLVKATRRTSPKHHFNRLVSRIADTLLGKQNRRLRQVRFDEFKRQHMNVSPLTFRNVDELYDRKLVYDAYICGSDQIWNPYSPLTSPEPYMLTFAPEKSRRIAYAPSFGAHTLPASLRKQYARWISSIDFLSARELTGAEIIHSLTGRKAPVVLDPSLLLNQTDWSTLASVSTIASSMRYILLYDRIYTPYGLATARHIARKTGLQILRIPQTSYRLGIQRGVKHLYEIGPAEFLGLFACASFVVTSSFHGTAFAINFQKPFLTIVRHSNSKNSRLESLLGRLRLESRLLPEGSPWPDALKVDYTSVSRRLQAQRETSLAYLNDAFDI